MSPYVASVKVDSTILKIYGSPLRAEGTREVSDVIGSSSSCSISANSLDFSSHVAIIVTSADSKPTRPALESSLWRALSWFRMRIFKWLMGLSSVR